MTDLEQHLQAIAQVPILLVASDYDGTLAPIVGEPASARPHREAIVALRMLASLPQTQVAVISGRALRDLAALTGLPEDVHLVGSHGSEFEVDFAGSLSEEATKLRQEIETELAAIAAVAGDGFLIETKPASVAFHYRNAAADHAARALRAIEEGPAALDGVYIKHGKKVIELGVVPTSKGAALEAIRRRVGASAVLFFGDDRTDEDAFSTLTGPDVAVKVGEGETAAPYRISVHEDVARILARVSELRADWLAGSKAVPIEHHSMLSDQRTVALVAPTARIVWLCMPRHDSPALFAELLGGPAAGHFSVSAADGAEPSQQKYIAGSMVVQTRWPAFTVTDFLDCSGGRPTQRAGRSDLVRVIEGRGKVLVEFAPRLDFGRVSTQLEIRDLGLVVEETFDPIVLRSPGLRWSIHGEGSHHTARAEVELGDSPVILELRYGTGDLNQGSTSGIERQRLTERYWLGWSDQLVLPPAHRDLLRRSALALKGLWYAPSGAQVAAATTGLPEHMGGVRNWDYRYCWLRDTAMAAATLVRIGSNAEAMQFLDWVLGVIDDCVSPERLRPLYTVTAGEVGSEAEIAELSGYRGSRPIRVGNVASQQVQLDVFGPVVDLVALLMDRDAPLSSEHWRLVEAMVEAVQHRWDEPDHGIWEIRRPRRHHVHSKVMCWLTVDRAGKIARRFLDRDCREWTKLRDRIAEDVLAKGFKPNVNAFSAAYDGDDLDAAALHVGLSGLLPPDDPRFAGTVAAVERVLALGPTVYRYRSDDGLPGFEGGFHICTSWLINSYLLMGRVKEAQELFDQFVALAGPTGLLSEQYGPKTRRALGNHPQAYSHLGLIDSAVRLADAKIRSAEV
jgi:trehalose 6-phosphate phosphatase